jgi:hypothetical protein
MPNCQKEWGREVSDKKSLSETDNCAKFITPAITDTGWNEIPSRRSPVARAAAQRCPALHTVGLAQLFDDEDELGI